MGTCVPGGIACVPVMQEVKAGGTGGTGVQDHHQLNSKSKAGLVYCLLI